MVLSELDKAVEFITEDKLVNKRPRSSSFGSCFKDSFICHESLIRLQRNTKGLTPVSLICYAVFQQNAFLLKTLLRKHPFAVNGLSEDGISPLHVAVACGNQEILKLLVLDGNANINILDVNGLIPLQYAVKNGQFDTAQYLIEHGSHLFDIGDGKYI